jgi:hypothetical protein
MLSLPVRLSCSLQRAEHDHDIWLHIKLKGKENIKERKKKSELHKKNYP